MTFRDDSPKSTRADIWILIYTSHRSISGLPGKFTGEQAVNIDQKKKIDNLIALLN